MDRYELTEANFILYAASHYDNPHCESMDEFHEDVNKVRYLKRLFTKYKLNGEINERLALNHLIMVYNVFGPKAGTNMLFFKIREHWDVLKPFVLMLGCLPETLVIDSKTVHTADIAMNQEIVDRLRTINAGS